MGLTIQSLRKKTSQQRRQMKSDPLLDLISVPHKFPERNNPKYSLLIPNR
ncbi:hypothetical protein LEP1GSC060_0888 [Leptospira weilii serovar Ranarum str. ICFT]|uniref:Uncharacterized protein n=1 Tax=Leptospira weilii serovar Ranarum str. ICFT TaxID=1218598 RepID=N1WV66_9LEPT|nr:hypothetical protein LEP1GSC060_0888 [Leptospira weilii serovar Ranarum str. ICFT]